MKGAEVGAASFVMGCIGMSLVGASAWATHVVTCFQTGQQGFLLAGAIAVPIGVIHGVGLW